MLGRLIPVKKDLLFARTYPVPRDTVWQAWTDPVRLRQWWGPDKTLIPECEIDARVGGQFRVVMEAGEEMGKYRGTRWPMVGTITVLEPAARMVVEARSWTEGSEAETTIHHTNTLTLADAANGSTAGSRLMAARAARRMPPP